MKVTVSKIKRRWLRRTVIVATYPLAAAGQILLCLWNALVDVVAWQFSLAASAAREWRK